MHRTSPYLCACCWPNSTSCGMLDCRSCSLTTCQGHASACELNLEFQLCPNSMAEPVLDIFVLIVGFCAVNLTCRIVEIRSCTSGPAHVVDWAGNHDSIIVTGNAVFEGNMLFKGGHVLQRPSCNWQLSFMRLVTHLVRHCPAMPAVLQMAQPPLAALCVPWQAPSARVLFCKWQSFRLKCTSCITSCWFLLCLQALAGLRTLCAAKAVSWWMHCTLQAPASLNTRCACVDVGVAWPGRAASGQWKVTQRLDEDATCAGLEKLLHVMLNNNVHRVRHD